MRGKPRNRFEVQIVYDGGAWWRETSRRDVPISRLDVADSLEEMAARIRKSEQAREAKKAAAAVDPPVDSSTGKPPTRVKV